LIDALRGLAIAQMIVYHFIFDLNFFGFSKVQVLLDQPWIAWRTAIVSQFLLLAGISLSLRSAFKPAWQDFWRRWRQIALAAVLVSVGSWIAFGPYFIWFGILHFLLLALLIVRLMLPLAAWNLALGAAAVLIGLVFTHELFDIEPLSAMGFVTHKPYRADYVPLLPWIGVVLIGAGLGSLWQRHGFALVPWAQRLNRRPPRVLVRLGTWSLSVYLVHQPLLMALLIAVRALTAV
jgi:uncharacterized membrane protein